MTSPPLRPYQDAVVANYREAVTSAVRRVLIVAPTGAGKTVIATAIIAEATQDRRRVLFLAHRRELIVQASRKLHAAGIDHGILLPGYTPRAGEPVQVASIATLHARAVRSSSIDLPDADVIVLDEAHHARAKTYKKLLDAYPDAVIVGLTATPCRGDGRGLGNTFQKMIECPGVAELIKDGYLVPTKVYAPSRPDLTGVKVERGDFVESQLAVRMDKSELVGDVVTHWIRLAQRRPTVVFATGVQHSVHIRDEFRRAGVLAEHIDGVTPTEERDRILSQLAAGKIELVSNAQVLCEGWDEPSVSCLVLARPTRNLGLYRQMVGRVLRPSAGKVDALILDHAGATFLHGFAEDPVEWSLSEDRLAENKAHTSRGTPRAPALTTCPECDAVRMQGQPCGACGWRPQPRAASVQVQDGELGEVDRASKAVQAIRADARERTKFHAMLLWIGREKSYKPGWAAAQYRQKFGAWPAAPSWSPPAPELPSPEVRAWVRSRQIAYARERAAEQAAAQ